MKTHRTTTLETPESFQQRFRGAHTAVKRIKGIALGMNRRTQEGKWSHALNLWKRVKSGAISGPSAAAVCAEYAGKFAQFERNGGRLPFGV